METLVDPLPVRRWWFGKWFGLRHRWRLVDRLESILSRSSEEGTRHLGSCWKCKRTARLKFCSASKFFENNTKKPQNCQISTPDTNFWTHCSSRFLGGMTWLLRRLYRWSILPAGQGRPDIAERPHCWTYFWIVLYLWFLGVVDWMACPKWEKIGCPVHGWNQFLKKKFEKIFEKNQKAESLFFGEITNYYF